MILAKNLTVLAAVAHPDDIEFYFAGTLLLLQKAGCSIHMWNLADGCCGTMQHTPQEIAQIRSEEATASANLAGAQIHPPLFHDLEIFYDLESLRSVAAVVRSIRPQIVLTHASSDYMEDHQNVCRLIVSAAFSHAIPNFRTTPDALPYPDSVRLYHAPPHGLRDGMGEPFHPDFLIDISSVMKMKREMLACHKSQQEWLAATQGMNAYLDEMERRSSELGQLGSEIAYAEVWRRHSALGFGPADFDPLADILKPFFQDLKPQDHAHAKTH